MIISVLSSIVIWGLTMVLALRILNFSGIMSGRSVNSRAYGFLCADLRRTDKPEEEARALKIFIAAVIFRLVIYVFETMILMMYANDDFTFATFMRRMEIWDSTNFYRIATEGYSGYTDDGRYITLAFFPLYPYTAKVLSFIVRNMRISLLLTSTLAFAGGCTYLYKLCAVDYGASTAKRAVILTAVAPFGCFFGTMMSESMLFFTSIATMYYIRKHNWPLAGVWGALAALSRMIGIMLALAAAVEWLEEYRIFEKLKNKDIKTVWKLFYSKGAWIFLMLLGTGIYLFCNYKVTGEWFKFLEYQHTYWHHGSAYFGRGISNIFSNAVGADQKSLMRMHIPSIGSIIFVAAAMIYGLKRNRSMYIVYLLAYFVVNMSVDWIISTPRYLSCAIPTYIILADFTARHKKTEEMITILSAISFGVYLVAYLHDFLI